MVKKVLITIFVVAVLVTAARVFISLETVQNLASSPTIKKGETVLIDHSCSVLGTPLTRFDLISFVPPYINGQLYNPPQSALTQFSQLLGIPFAPIPATDMRRIIALPGETVVIRRELGIFVDGKLLNETSYTKDEPDTDFFVLADIMNQSAQEGEFQPYGHSDAPIVVPKDTVFVMADNRKEYPGSERWGFINQLSIVGKVTHRWRNYQLEELKAPTVVFATEKVAINDDGVRALDAGEYTKAIHLFKSALAIDNNFELARDNLSIAYNNFAIQSASSKPEVALDSLHKALFLDPDNPLTRKNLSGLIKRMGKNPNSYEDRVKLAEDAQDHGKSISALVEYREAAKIKLDPSILAQVSTLEKKCNFPAHAIPEDLVTAEKPKLPAAETKKLQADSEETKLAMAKPPVTRPSKNADSKPISDEPEAAPPAEKQVSPKTVSKKQDVKPAIHTDKEKAEEKKETKKSEPKKESKKTETEKIQSPKTSEEPELRSDDAIGLKESGEKTAEKEVKKTKLEKEKTKIAEERIEEQVSQKKKDEESTENKVKVAQKVEEKAAETPVKKESAPKTTPLKHRELKQTSTGFDIGKMWRNIMSAMASNRTPKPNEAGEYRGPPLLKKPHQLQLP